MPKRGLGDYSKMPKPVLHSGLLHWAPRKAYIVYLQEFKSLQILELLYEKEN